MSGPGPHATVSAKVGDILRRPIETHTSPSIEAMLGATATLALSWSTPFQPSPSQL